MAVRRDGREQPIQDAELAKAINQLLKPIKAPAFEEKPMSEAFGNDEEDVKELDEEFEAEDILCGADDDEKRRPFEDCPMPILKCELQVGDEKMQIRMLIDSGSSLDLISGALARKLRKKGCEVRNIGKGVRIKVANGKKSIVREALPLKLRFYDESTEQIDFLTSEDLPFDFILGNVALKRWRGVIDWEKNAVSITPGPDKKRLTLDWNTYCGQHWRKPSTLTTAEDVLIPPESQKALMVEPIDEEETFGLTSTKGLVTPLRTAAAMSNKFRVAYSYGESIERVVVMNPTKMMLKIKKGTQLAEFHMRPTDAFEVKEMKETARSSAHLNRDDFHEKLDESIGVRSGKSVTGIDTIPHCVDQTCRQCFSCRSPSGVEPPCNVEGHMKGDHMHNNTNGQHDCGDKHCRYSETYRKLINSESDRAVEHGEKDNTQGEILVLMHGGEESGPFNTSMHEHYAGTASDSNSIRTPEVQLSNELTHLTPGEGPRDSKCCLEQEIIDSLMQRDLGKLVNLVTHHDSNEAVSTGEMKREVDESTEEDDWNKEPLKNVSLKELIQERTPEEVKKLKHVI